MTSRRVCYTAQFKLKVIEAAEQVNNRSAAQRYDVGLSNVQLWRRNKDKLQAEGEREKTTKASFALTSRRVSYTAAFKVKVVEVAEEQSNRAAARKFNISESNVRSWRKNKDILEGQSHWAKAPGRGRKAQYPLLEQQMLEYVNLLKAKGYPVIQSDLRLQALQLTLQQDPSSTFKASAKWGHLFMKRHKIPLAHRKSSFLDDHLKSTTTAKSIKTEDEEELWDSEDSEDMDEDENDLEDHEEVNEDCKDDVKVERDSVDGSKRNADLDSGNSKGAMHGEGICDDDTKPVLGTVQVSW